MGVCHYNHRRAKRDKCHDLLLQRTNKQAGLLAPEIAGFTTSEKRDSQASLRGASAVTTTTTQRRRCYAADALKNTRRPTILVQYTRTSGEIGKKKSLLVTSWNRVTRKKSALETQLDDAVHIYPCGAG